MKTNQNNYSTAKPFGGGLIVALALVGLFIAPNPLHASLTGAIFTTDSTCTGVNLNIYDNKDAVFLDGGPAHPNSAGLPDGLYCVQVTEPDGTVLGRSAEGAVHVTNGKFDACYQLSLILNTASSDFTAAGYDTTTNMGGEYKAWVSTDCTFVPSNSKTDNFKVRSGGGGPGDTADLCVRKFYDANVNGIWDTTEVEITGWQFTLFGTVGFDTMQISHTDTPWCSTLDPDTFTVMELDALAPPTWIHTTSNTVVLTVGAGQHGDALFGNVCLGAGGGLTLGFWSNKNGQSLETVADFILLSNLNLKTATGTDQNFNGTAAKLATDKTTLNTFLLGANATNMANMLSAQLAAMELNVSHYGVANKFGAGVNGASFVSAPGCGNTGLNNQFITINDLMAAANTELGLHPLTLSGNAFRAYQECLKNALDDANNNRNFVQGAPCTFSFGQ